MAPFVDRYVDPSWFRNRFHGVTPSVAAMSNSIWAYFLTLTLLSTWIETGTTCFRFIIYQYNSVARQFGFSQMLPKSLCTWENDICWSERKFSAQEYRDCMAFVRQQVLELPTSHLQISFYPTIEFDNWWLNYFQGNSSLENFRKRLPTTFSNLQESREKK